MNAYFNEWPRFKARLPVKELTFGSKQFQNGRLVAIHSYV